MTHLSWWKLTSTLQDAAGARKFGKNSSIADRLDAVGFREQWWGAVDGHLSWAGFHLSTYSSERPVVTVRCCGLMAPA
jgi:hypothetical protein